MAQKYLFLVIGSLVGFCMTAQAHHSWGAVYDGGSEVNDLNVVIAGPHTRRPHDAIKVKIKNELGEPEEWTVQWRGEGGGRGRGMGGDVDQVDLNVGDEVTIDGQYARDESSKLIQMTLMTRTVDGSTVIQARQGRGGRGGGRRR